MYFPAKKQVSFRPQLEEEIKTVRFVARHSDIESGSEHDSEVESESDSGSESGSSQSEDHSSSGEDDGDAQNRQVRRKKRKSISSERQIRAAALRDGLDDERLAGALSAAPESSGQKRRCKWRWTLGNLAPSQIESEPDNAPSSSTHTSPSTASIGETKITP